MLRHLKRLAGSLAQGRVRMAASRPVCNFGEQAHAFDAAGDRRPHLQRSADLKGPNGTRDRLHVQPLPLREGGDRPADPRRERPRRPGISVDRDLRATTPTSYPDDSFANMKRWALEKRFPFAYLHDETQEVARAYGAVCTPDFFGYNGDLRAAVSGPARRVEDDPAARRQRELFEAMKQVAETGRGPERADARPWAARSSGSTRPSAVT